MSETAETLDPDEIDHDPVEYATDTTYGSDFDPIEQFNAIDPADFAWYSEDSELVVIDGNQARAFNGWETVAHAVEDAGVVHEVPSDMVSSVLDDPVGWREDHSRGVARDPAEKACNELAYLLTERTYVERDVPKF